MAFIECQSEIQKSTMSISNVEKESLIEMLNEYKIPIIYCDIIISGVENGKEIFFDKKMNVPLTCERYNNYTAIRSYLSVKKRQNGNYCMGWIIQVFNNTLEIMRNNAFDIIVCIGYRNNLQIGFDKFDIVLENHEEMRNICNAIYHKE